MQFITSTLVEFEQKDIAPVNSERLLLKQRQIQAFYYELYDSFLRGEKYIVRYMFYKLSEIRKLTSGQLRKQFASISKKIQSVSPEEMTLLKEETGNKELILYTDGSYPEENALAMLQEAQLPLPVMTMTETDPLLLTELRKAVFYTFRKDAFLVLAHRPALTASPLFYNIMEEHQIPFRSLSFAWMCRKNLKLMQAMTLYQLSAY